MSAQIRPATPADADALARIYNAGIASREATFETRPRTREEAAAWLDDGLPLLVAERHGRVDGFARLTPYSDRCAYGGIAEFTVYLDPAARGAGLGTALLEALAEAAPAAGLHKLVGRLFTTNAASRALARRCGFREVGVHRRHGEIDGQWRDVLVVERLLGPQPLDAELSRTISS